MLRTGVADGAAGLEDEEVDVEELDGDRVEELLNVVAHDDEDEEEEPLVEELLDDVGGEDVEDI